ncbi:uncharacterized protein LOC111376360, partial [Olea europaea var. sylvestris]|uniref:uncharacterized protein LOC111376360 n=1 Tax=Olea europaea var. sylvestris TaxID=158386 RepID=UPI000C1D83D0
QTRIWKLKTKLCSRYDNLDAIFGNDSATGDRAVTGNDILSPDHDENLHEVDGQNEDTDPSPIHSPKRNAEGGTNKVRHRHTQPNDESLVALSSIAESSKKIANTMETQATLDTLNHINWQLVLEKLQGMSIEKSDIMQVMKIFRSDESLARVFMSLTDEEFMRDLVFENLGRDPPPLF